MTPTLSVIVPTLGRSSLARALSSCAGADEVICVADGEDSRDAERVFAECGLPGRCATIPKSSRPGGSDARNAALALCTSAWIAYMDDDDCFLSDAIAIIKKSLTVQVPHFFRVEIQHGELIVVWRKPKLAYGDISTIGIVHPNGGDLPAWEGRAAEDHHFAERLMAKFGNAVWVDEIVARSERRGGWRR